MILFEALSGIKINMSLIPINISEEAGNALAQIFGCTSTTFPIKYLGVPLTDRRLKISDWGQRKNFKVGLANYSPLEAE